MTMIALHSILDLGITYIVARRPPGTYPVHSPDNLLNATNSLTAAARASGFRTDMERTEVKSDERENVVGLLPRESPAPLSIAPTTYLQIQPVQEHTDIHDFLVPLLRLVGDKDSINSLVQLQSPIQ